MPMPQTYQRSSQEWRSFLEDAKQAMDLDSNNMAYTAVDAVLQVFRKRLTAQQGLDFASTLPAVLRAIFVKDWDVSREPVPFARRVELTEEVKRVRPHHNFTPDNAIEAVAHSVRNHVDLLEFERCLASLPEEAQAYWSMGVETGTLQTHHVSDLKGS